MDDIGPMREFIRHLIYFHGERIYFGNLDRDDQLNMIGRALFDKHFENLEIFTMDREMIQKAIEGTIESGAVVDYMKDQLIADYELYLDDIIEDEYHCLGYGDKNVINIPEPDFERILLAEELRKERNQRQHDYKYKLVSGGL